MAITAPLPPVPKEGLSQEEYKEMEEWYQAQDRIHAIGLTVSWGFVLVLIFALFFICAVGG